MRKIMGIIALIILTAALGAGCSSGEKVNAPAFDGQKAVKVVSREDGSGTRGAFIELFGIEVKTPEGGKKDMTTKEAVIAKQTDVMMTTVAGDKYAIGYISLGSLNNSVKAVNIEGVAASADNVKNGAYSVSRAFNIVTIGETSALAKDFIDFILSAEGQAVVAKNYIAVNETAAAYAGTRPAGKLVVAGSSSVTPVMEKLKEAYLKINSQAAVEIQQSDSSAGISGVINGSAEIGMSSRDLKPGEKEKLIDKKIAIDGIAIIINKDNPLNNLSKEEVKQIFTGQITSWGNVVK